MLRFVFHKLLNKKWMVAAMLVGNILLSALASATAVYTRTSLQRALELTFERDIEENNRYPVRMSLKTNKVNRSANELLMKIETRLSRTGEDLRLPLKLMRSYYYLNAYEAESSDPRGEAGSRLSVVAMQDLQSHVKLFGAEAMSTSVNEDGSVDGYLPKRVMKSQRLALGEKLTFEDVTLSDGTPLTIRIAGYFLMADETDPYWVDTPADNAYRTCIFIDEGLFKSLFMENRGDTRVSAEWHMLYDYSDLTVSEVDRMMRVTEALREYCKKNFSYTPDFTWSTYLADFLVQAKKVRTTYLVLQVPIFVLLVLFIFMVSSRIVDNEESEIAVLNSRGAGRGQIFLIYLLQSLLISAFAGGIGLLLARPLTRLLSSANGFLEFIRRKDLRVEMNAEAFLYAGIASGISILAMLLPAMRFSGANVIQSREKKRKYMKNAPFWHRYFLDLILLAVSLYGLYSFNSRKDQMMQQVLLGNTIDPLLYLSTAVFMAGAGLLILRLIPYVQKLIFRIGKNRWSPALYASHTYTLGTGRESGFIMLFLVMTVATGIFNATAARTISENDNRNIRYMNGADLVVEERWESSAGGVPEGGGQPVSGTWFEPNYDKYEELPGFSSVTRVSTSKNGSLYFNDFKSSVQKVLVTGIEPKKYGETAEFDASLMKIHWYRFLNALSARRDAVILSANFKTLGVKIGDRVQYYVPSGVDESRAGIEATVYGFVDYWPGYNDASYEIQTDGSVKESDQYLVIARLDTMQENWGTVPYAVWLKSENGSTDSFYDMAESRDLKIASLHDTEQEIVAARTGAIKQGTNGIFTVSFITSLVLCTVGFLIYWISSVKSRELQFGVLRAMGLKFREIITMLLNEQFFVSVLSIASGYLVGFLTGRFFMPLIRLAYSSADYPVPLLVVRELSDELRLFAIVSLMIVTGLIVIAGIIRRMRIAEALKLGED